MRPDVAQAFDRMERAARADGVALSITSAFRSDAEQAELFRRHPDPKWVAPPGHSLHRYGTELDLGPKSAYPWLAANGERFHFIQRYSWEPWHWGFALNAGATVRGAKGDGEASGTTPELRPAAVRPAARPRGAALERVGGAARGPDLRGEQLQPVRREPARARRGSRSSCRARRPRSGSRTRSTPPRRSTPRRT